MGCSSNDFNWLKKEIGQIWINILIVFIWSIHNHSSGRIEKQIIQKIILIQETSSWSKTNIDY